MNTQYYQTKSAIVTDIMDNMNFLDGKRKAMANYARLHLNFPVDTAAEELAVELRAYLYKQEADLHTLQSEYSAKLVSFAHYAQNVYFGNETDSLWTNILSGKSNLHRWNNYR
ncbi:hypothetical protein [Weissella confusa]|uniref:hypothetical protein n=1 Tax=Weissella confusa TaxID=1583 RepID=UPI0018F19A53|nr:hypothetical protein [Weissella confusa]MBJ7673289.1 hypothetical protein [Weissella confusa]